MPKVKRSCNADKHYPSEDEMTEEDALRASWDYWERLGRANPLKRREDRITPLKSLSSLTADTNSKE